MNMGSRTHTHTAVDKMKYKLEIHYNDHSDDDGSDGDDKNI